MPKIKIKNIPLAIAGVLLMLVLVTSCTVGGMLARYTSTNVWPNAAHTAVFDVAGDGFSQVINLQSPTKPGEVGGNGEGYSFLIRNKSEVAIEYRVTLKNTTNNLPLDLMVAGADESELDKFHSDEGYTFTKTIGPNDAEGSNFEFSICWPAEKNDLKYSGMIDNISVTVAAEQVD